MSQEQEAREADRLFADGGTRPADRGQSGQEVADRLEELANTARKRLLRTSPAVERAVRNGASGKSLVGNVTGWEQNGGGTLKGKNGLRYEFGYVDLVQS